jgi:Ca-activated chloride channel family protein
LKKLTFRNILTKILLVTILLIPLTLTHCSINKPKLVILSGSENKTLEPLINEFKKKNNIDIEMHYKGSVDIMMELNKEKLDYDAVWPANSIWISMGDVNHVVKYQQSIMTSPVVFGIKKSLAQQLGFIGKKVSVKDILKAITDKKLTFTMTSASQSNSGASAYFGFLYSFLNNPEMITKEDLHKPELKNQIRGLLSGINRSSGSSDWLKELFLKGNYDAMVNYESLIIEANQELIKEGREPLYVVYPYDGLAISDSPLGYINKGDTVKEGTFKKFQQYLLTNDTQKKILAYGRRTGFGGTIENPDPKVFNKDWGIDTAKVLSPIKFPSSDVIREALALYQTEFKKPSYTVFCVDISGSMAGNGEEQMKEAMNILLDESKAKNYFLQMSKDDVIVVIPFNNTIQSLWEANGKNKNGLLKLQNDIYDLASSGGTDIYTPVITALDKMKNVDLSGYIPAIILMTDGESNTGKTVDDLRNYLTTVKKDIPVFSIMFGNASESQLSQIANLTNGTVFDGKKNLIDAFRKAKGYN